MAFLEVEALQFRYQDLAMRFDLSVEAGECLAVIGPSGAGKSSLLALIAGFQTPLAGSIRVAGGDILALPPAERPVTSLFQEHNLFAHLTVAENVGLGLHPGLRFSPEDREAIATSLEEVGLAGFEARLPGQLSGGERQRVALARCLLRRRPLLLLDEPFAALGPGQSRDMLRLVRNLQERFGLTVLMVSHDPRDAETAASRTAFLAAGTILLAGPTGEVLASRHPVIRAYLGD